MNLILEIIKYINKVVENTSKKINFKFFYIVNIKKRIEI